MLRELVRDMTDERVLCMHDSAFKDGVEYARIHGMRLHPRGSAKWKDLVFLVCQKGIRLNACGCAVSPPLALLLDIVEVFKLLTEMGADLVNERIQFSNTKPIFNAASFGNLPLHGDDKSANSSLIRLNRMRQVSA